MKKEIKRIKTVLCLNRDEKRLFLASFFLLFRVRFHIRFSSFITVLQWVKQRSPYVGNLKKSTPERLAWMIESIGIAFPRFLMCLPRALAGFIFLRRCGWDVTLKIGTRRRRPDLPIEAHAWLEYKDEIIIGKIAGMEKYAIFESLQGQYI